jgi:hypothetical protein
MYHNPFPQLSKVAVAPFFNLSTEPSVDGRQFAEAYGNELQAIPGFEVVPVGVVERAMQAHHNHLSTPEEARALAQQLGVDAIVVGAVADFTPYYPPRCSLQVEWYAANPFFHPIPPGYGLPWGTPEEKEIPEPLVLEAEMALARAQLKTQTPPFAVEPPHGAPGHPRPLPPSGQPPEEVLPAPTQGSQAKAVSYESSAPCDPRAAIVADVSNRAGAIGINGLNGQDERAIPPNWPDERGFFPPPPTARLGALVPSNDPVLRHTNIYDGADGEFTNSLSNYYFFRSDDRGSNWRGYLTRMPDFIRFCCYRHITEMISARGGVDEARVVWQWYKNR